MIETNESIKAPVNWGSHTVNIRISFPVLRGRWYMAILGGTERWDASRWALDRQRYPLWTIGNVLFAIGLVAIFYGLVILAMAPQTSMIDF